MRDALTKHTDELLDVAAVQLERLNAATARMLDFKINSQPFEGIPPSPLSECGVLQRRLSRLFPKARALVLADWSGTTVNIEDVRGGLRVHSYPQGTRHDHIAADLLRARHPQGWATA